MARIYFILAAIIIGPASGPIVSYFSKQDLAPFQMAIIVLLTSNAMLGLIAAAPPLERWLVRIIQPLRFELGGIRHEAENDPHTARREWRQIASARIRNTGSQPISNVTLNIVKTVPLAQQIIVERDLTPMSDQHFLPLPQRLRFDGGAMETDLGPGQVALFDLVSYVQSDHADVRIEGLRQLFWVGQHEYELVVEATGHAPNVGKAESMSVFVSLGDNVLRISSTPSRGLSPDTPTALTR
jgi:hypothetical protein